MKQRIIIAVVAALISGAGAYVAGGGCNTPQPQSTQQNLPPVVITMPGDSVYLPGRLVTRERVVDLTDTARIAALEHSIDSVSRVLAATKLRLRVTEGELAAVTYLAAEQDTALPRTARIALGDREVHLSWVDSVSIGYDFPPFNGFRLVTRDTRMTLSDSLVSALGFGAPVRPWWRDAVAVSVKAAAAYPMEPWLRVLLIIGAEFVDRVIDAL